MSSATAALRAAGAKNCGLDKIIAQCSDLAVQVVDGSHPGKACSFDYVGSVRNHQQLCNEEKHSLLWLLAQAPAFHGIIKASDLGEGHELPDWVKCAGMMGVHISRQDPDVSERVYKMRGVAEVPVSTEVTFELVTEFDQMQKWDSMLQSMEVIEQEPRQYPILRIGTFINTYGVPGMSWLFNDRQFVCRGVAVHFPDGTRALVVYTPSTSHPADTGNSKSRTVRAHMGVSGYVVSPYAGVERRYLGEDKCQITMVLQVDPRGGVPLPVYNTVNMLMPMNLQRVKAAATKLKPEEKEAMTQRQVEILAASKLEAAKAVQSGCN